MLLSKEICNFAASPETIDKTLCLVLISGSCHKQNVYFCRCITLGSSPAGLNLNLRHSTAHTQIETWKWWPVLIALMRGDFLGSPPDKFILFRHYAHRETHTLTVWLRQTSFNWTPKKSSEGWWAYSHFWHQEIIVIWRRNSKRVSPPLALCSVCIYLFTHHHRRLHTHTNQHPRKLWDVLFCIFCPYWLSLGRLLRQGETGSSTCTD